VAAGSPIDDNALGRATLARQYLLDPLRTGDAAALVAAVGSLQAQHPEWPPIAAATRAANPRTADLAGALLARTVVRSQLMRRTIHVVAADDFWPMWAVVQPMRVDGWRQLTKEDPVASTVAKRLHAAHPAVHAALRERPMSSLEIDRFLAAEAGVDPNAVTRPAWRQPDVAVVARAAWRHYSAFVPLVHVPFDGERYGRSQYALAEDWLASTAPRPAGGDPADAHRHLARSYLGAFGPASLDDLVSYVGRGRGGIGVWRAAIAALDDEAITLSAPDGRTLHDLADAPRPAGDTVAPPRLLARWDSALLSHAASKRQRILADEDRDRVFSKNADVLPTILVDGRVAGTWELRRSRDGAAITLRPFRRQPRAVADATVAEAERLLGLVGLIGPKASRREVEIELPG
jgi:hypothetical protein